MENTVKIQQQYLDTTQCTLQQNCKRLYWNYAMKSALIISAGVTVALLAGMIGYILYIGIPYLTWDLLASQSSYLTKNIGILPNILNTLYIIFVALILVLPIGIGAAVYLTEYARNQKLVAIIEFAAETLTGIPSIIFGLVGMILFTEMLGLKQGVLAGGLTLLMIVLPLIIRTTQESLKTVPQEYREGALALGSGKWHMIRTVVLPNSLGGIITGCVLAIGRISGESAALLFTAGFGLVLNDFFHALESSSATLTVALYIYASERGEIGIAFAIATVLLLMTFILNYIANSFAKLNKNNKKKGATS